LAACHRAAPGSAGWNANGVAAGLAGVELLLAAGAGSPGAAVGNAANSGAAIVAPARAGVLTPSDAKGSSNVALTSAGLYTAIDRVSLSRVPPMAAAEGLVETGSPLAGWGRATQPATLSRCTI
jgi:hypothetical protein